MRKLEIQDHEYKHRYGSLPGPSDKTDKSLKGLLLERGYTEAQIRYMRLNNQVVFVPTTYASKVKYGQAIYIIDEPPAEKVKKAKPSTRFANITDDDEDE